MKIAVIGTGYVGLVAGAGFSEFGSRVTCVDIDEDRIAGLRRGVIPIHEPGLEALVRRNAAQRRLSFSTRAADAVAGADVIIIAVGTPQTDGGAADTGAVVEAAREIGRALTGWAAVAIKSTVPVGTGERVRAIIAAETRHECAVVSNPEFLKEGDAVNDFMKPSRVILGSDDARAITVLRRLYAPLVRTQNRIHVMDSRSAELSKYASNCMLATRISFMNEMALLAEKLGADVEAVRRAVGADPRIGPKFLFPGPGFGGSCFPKDLSALIHTAGEVGADIRVIRAARDANERQKRVLPERVIAHFGGGERALAERRITVWGVAFKPETDDIRESPALALIDELCRAGARVCAYDPAAGERAQEWAGDRHGDAVEIADDMYDAARDADALVLVTEWHQFRRPDFAHLGELMRGKVAFDGRNIWDPEELAERGFLYHGIGRRAGGQSASAPDFQ